jgi:hypothetical protein
VAYSAAANPGDPILKTPIDPVTGYPFTGLTDNGDVFKTNFWSVAFQAYDPFYPPGVLAKFYDPDTPANNRDVGLPVPNVEHLYIGPDGRVNSGDESLSAVMHAMPGIANPYRSNPNQVAEEHYGDKPFFVNFPFGYVANDVNWFEGAGVPFAAYDDFGRENPYPLVRVQAKSGSTVLATVDTVLPISGEASCKNCHGSPLDVPDSANKGKANAKLIAAGLPVEDSGADPSWGRAPLSERGIRHRHQRPAPARYQTRRRLPQRRRQAHRLLRDHHGQPDGNANCLVNKALKQGKSVVCQVCHYTPALDLAQLGPLGGDAANPDAAANGRVQRIHKSNSRILHMAHSKTGLFPAMPRPPPTAQPPGCLATRPPARRCSTRPATSATPGTRPSACAGPWLTAAWSVRTAMAKPPR